MGRWAPAQGYRWRWGRSRRFRPRRACRCSRRGTATRPSYRFGSTDSPRPPRSSDCRSLGARNRTRRGSRRWCSSRSESRDRRGRCRRCTPRRSCRPRRHPSVQSAEGEAGSAGGTGNELAPRTLGAVGVGDALWRAEVIRANRGAELAAPACVDRVAVGEGAVPIREALVDDAEAANAVGTAAAIAAAGKIMAALLSAPATRTVRRRVGGTV